MEACQSPSGPRAGVSSHLHAPTCATIHYSEQMLYARNMIRTIVYGTYVATYNLSLAERRLYG